jgi:phospholipid-binding lipoprotein MlaA
MRKLLLFFVPVILLFVFQTGLGLAFDSSNRALAENNQTRSENYGPGDDLMAELGMDYDDPKQPAIADPLESWNRIMFQVNDKLYFWVMHPVARGYAATLPEPWRKSFGNAFENLATPVRAANDLLQGKLVRAGQEVGSCLINTLFGFGGLLKPSEGIAALQPDPPDTDGGLTLGTWGMGHGIYLFWPVIGPSSLRDSVGKVGDSFLQPLYFIAPWEVEVGVKSGEGINYLSLNLDQYEDLKEGALDPYTALKDGYIQYRKSALNSDE